MLLKESEFQSRRKDSIEVKLQCHLRFFSRAFIPSVIPLHQRMESERMFSNGMEVHSSPKILHEFSSFFFDFSTAIPSDLSSLSPAIVHHISTLPSIETSNKGERSNDSLQLSPTILTKVRAKNIVMTSPSKDNKGEMSSFLFKDDEGRCSAAQLTAPAYGECQCHINNNVTD